MTSRITRGWAHLGTLTRFVFQKWCGWKVSVARWWLASAYTPAEHESPWAGRGQKGDVRNYEHMTDKKHKIPVTGYEQDRYARRRINKNIAYLEIRKREVGVACNSLEHWVAFEAIPRVPIGARRELDGKC